MPLLVTDDDVLQQIALNDQEVARIQAQMTALGAAIPASTAAAWTQDTAQWNAWATAARARLSGGFFSGEWFGVAADGDAAISWKGLLDQYQAIVTSLALGKTPAALVPTSSSLAAVSSANNAGIAQTGTDALDSAAGALKWVAIGIVGLAAGFFLVQRR